MDLLFRTELQEGANVSRPVCLEQHRQASGQHLLQRGATGIRQASRLTRAGWVTGFLKGICEQ